MRNEAFRKNIIYLVLITLFSSIFLFYNLGSFSLNHLDEGLFSSIAYEMEESGNYSVLSVRGEGFFHKQPLRFWFNILSIKMFGVSNFSLRFSSAFFAFSLLICVYLLGRLIYGKAEVGFLAVFILLGSPHFLFERMGRNVEEDSLGVFLVSLFFLLILYFAKNGKNVFLYFSFFVLGLLGITKLAFCGFAGVVVLLFFLLYSKKIGVGEIVTGVLIFIFVSFPWHIWQYFVEDINFLKIYLAEIAHFLSPSILSTDAAVSFFGEDILQRLGGKIVMGIHADAFYYLWVLLIGFFPWVYFSFLNGGAMVITLKQNVKDLKILPFLWMFLPLLLMLFFYEKRTWRINIITPALALLAADFIVNCFRHRQKMILSCLLLAGCMIFYKVNQYGEPFYTPSLWAEHYLNFERLPKGAVLVYEFYFYKLLLCFMVFIGCLFVSRFYKKSYLKVVFTALLFLSMVLSVFSSFLLVQNQTYKSDMEIISAEVRKMMQEDSRMEVCVVAEEITKMFYAKLTPEFSDYSDSWADYFYVKVLGDKNILVVNTEFERLASLEKYEFFIFDKMSFAEVSNSPGVSDFIFDFEILKETNLYLLVKKKKQELK